MKLWEWARKWEELCEIEEHYVESGESAPVDGDPVLAEIAAMQAEIGDGLAAKVDGWIYMLQAAKDRADGLKRRMNEIEKALRASESREKRLKEYLVTLMRLHPKVKWRGAEAGELRIQKNGQPAVTTVFPRVSRSFSNVLLDRPQGVPDDLVKEQTVLVVDMDEVKKRAADGESFPWLHLETGYHVRIKQ